MPASASDPYRRSRYGFCPAFESEEIDPGLVEALEAAFARMDDQSFQTIGRVPRDAFAYDQRVKTLTRIATLIDAALTVVIGYLLRGAMAVLAAVLRRGKYREWRRRDAEAARQRSDASRS